MLIDKLALGNLIKQIRKARKLSQVQFSSFSGVSIRTLAALENGRTVASIDTLNKLSKAMDIPFACLAIFCTKDSGKKSVDDFTKSLRNLVSATVMAQIEVKE